MNLSENINRYRKAKNLSQEELAQKLNISRQSISLWENGQSQPTIDNIIALTKIFGITTDELLNDSPEAEAKEDASAEECLPEKKPLKRKSAGKIAALTALAVIALAALAVVFIRISRPSVDLFTCCKDFAIQNGSLHGDYCIYQQPSTLYGGFEDEYFSVSYWGDSDMVEFCLHCPLDETYSINFYLRMRGGYDGTYEYLSSRYFRSDGSSLRSASGHIDPAVFTDKYPLNCDSYEGSADGQTEFMEESRVGIRDLIWCLKEFVAVEQIGCSFEDFGFVNF